MSVTRRSETAGHDGEKVVEVMGYAQRPHFDRAAPAAQDRDDNLSEYAGKWVSLRHGEVVAVADSYQELMESPSRHRFDGALLVPPTANLVL
jgi:hypothetical protein